MLTSCIKLWPGGRYTWKQWECRLARVKSASVWVVGRLLVRSKVGTSVRPSPVRVTPSRRVFTYGRRGTGQTCPTFRLQHCGCSEHGKGLGIWTVTQASRLQRLRLRQVRLGSGYVGSGMVWHLQVKRTHVHQISQGFEPIPKR